MNNKNIQNTTLIELQKLLLQKNLAFVSYRLPGENEIVTLIQHQTAPQEISFSEFNYHSSGFIISPFVETNESKSWFLKPDIIINGHNIPEDTFNLIQHIQSISTKTTCINDQFDTTSKDFFCQNVDSALENIKSGEFTKVVISKTRRVKIESDFCAATFHHSLCEKYPNAMVYFLQIPTVGCWIGATPETLLKIENNIGHTVSLASTQLASGKNLENYIWDKKEIEEQAIVTNFVENSLKGFNLNYLKKTGPVNHQAANLIHLKTDFEFEINKSELTGKILNELHPTPSVGGLPKADARKFILTHEKHNRTYYTGFLGPVNTNGQTNIFVNLRCLQLFGNEFVLYSGAGITASSVPENEWLETDNKMLTMLNAMRTSKTPNPLREII